MKSQKNIFLPQVKKNLKNFLTDESGKITAKNAIGISLGASLLALGDTANAWHSNINDACGDTPGHANQAAHSSYDTAGHMSGPEAAHSSGIVNGHYNRTSAGAHQSSAITGAHINQAIVNAPTCAHSSHNSHGSHGSGGWC